LMLNRAVRLLHEVQFKVPKFSKIQ